MRGLELEIAVGELVAVIGPSGCGKSTFLHLAAGLDEPSAGDVSAFGTSLSRLDETGLAAYRARKTAVIFQSENLWPGLTAQENVETILSLSGVKESGRIAAEALGTFGLGERRQHRVTALSGGEQQRVAVAGAAARRADLVLADEPTGELDEANEAIVLDALRERAKQYGATVVVVSHSPRVADFADRVVGAARRKGRDLADPSRRRERRPRKPTATWLPSPLPPRSPSVATSASCSAAARRWLRCSSIST